jgi:hypothetical protein
LVGKRSDHGNLCSLGHGVVDEHGGAVVGDYGRGCGSATRSM